MYIIHGSKDCQSNIILSKYFASHTHMVEKLALRKLNRITLLHFNPRYYGLPRALKCSCRNKASLQALKLSFCSSAYKLKVIRDN